MRDRSQHIEMKAETRNPRSELSTEAAPPNRRDVVRLALHAMALVVLGGSVRALDLFRKKGGILRPPGALGEDGFRALCLACEKCEQICPQDVIVPVTLSENVVRAGTPRLSFAENYCNLCMRCTQVCPTGALQRIPQSRALIGVAKVKTERCAAWAGAACDLCTRMCPFRAIGKDSQSRPYVVPELCVGCGICEYACRLTAGMGFTKGVVVFPVGEAG